MEVLEIFFNMQIKSRKSINFSKRMTCLYIFRFLDISKKALYVVKKSFIHLKMLRFVKMLKEFSSQIFNEVLFISILFLCYFSKSPSPQFL